MTELIEKICELDDDLMMEYLEGEEPSVDRSESSSSEKLHVSVQLFRYAAVLLTETKVFRSFWMQSLSTCRLQQISLLSRVLTWTATKLRDILLMMSHSAALAFKIMTDPFVGKLALLPCLFRYNELRFLCTKCHKR